MAARLSWSQLAGLGAGVWKDIDEVRNIPKSTVRYYPDDSVRERYKGTQERWLTSAHGTADGRLRNSRAGMVTMSKCAKTNPT